eukprot:5148484-Amphidinium_carterae.1
MNERVLRKFGVHFLGHYSRFLCIPMVWFPEQSLADGICCVVILDRHPGAFDANHKVAPPLQATLLLPRQQIPSPNTGKDTWYWSCSARLSTTCQMVSSSHHGLLISFVLATAPYT